MRCELIELEADVTRTAAALRELVPAPEMVYAAVAEILAEVRTRGDAALTDYTRRFDTAGAQPEPVLVGDEELDRAAAALEPEIRTGLEHAIANVRRVAEASVHPDRKVEFGRHSVTVRSAALDRAGVYVPGGRAPYPSTVVMGVTVARVAGVEHVSVCAPPGREGDVDPVVLGACGVAGADTVYRMGGAQAIAALAYGTESVRAVDVIVGPGNLYVQEAKRQAFGQVGIDGFAGPSDLVVIADGDSDPDQIALDLLAQAEHGPGTLVIAASESSELLDALHERLAHAEETGAVAALIHLAGSAEALELAQAFAPEHLELIGLRSEALAAQSTHAGCVFVGARAATAFGDYIAGSNHILPTNGAARYASALNAGHFRRSFTEVRIADPGELAHDGAAIARAEGFEQHARSMEARIRENGVR